MQKITPFMWFDGQAEEAMKLYTSIFKNSKIVTIARYGDEMPAMKGKVLTGIFEIEGQQFMVIDGGPQFKFTEAISYLVDCQGQQEVDELWEKLSAGGSTGQCGWLKDKFGMSWQIVPREFREMMSAGDAEKNSRVMTALLKMTKIDIAELKRAAEQG